MLCYLGRVGGVWWRIFGGGRRGGGRVILDRFEWMHGVEKVVFRACFFFGVVRRFGVVVVFPLSTNSSASR